MASGPESKLVDKIRRGIDREYPESFVMKVHGNPYQTAGLPDLWCIVEGKVIGLEVKAQRPGESESHARGRATERQLATIESIRKAGGFGGVVLTVEESLKIISEAIS